jgi:hypothetical protein
MTHFNSDAQIERTTPPEWLKVGSNIGQLVNDWAGRSDLVAYVGDNAGIQHGAPALFDPKGAEIQVNIPIAFGNVTPEIVGDMRERSTQFEFLKASGAILHEALHARFSTWDLEKAARELPRPVCEALHLLEETRIESLGVKTFPANRSFLRACAMEIVLGDIENGALEKLSTTRQAAHLLGLTSARVDAGVLDDEDVEPMTAVVATILPPKTFNALSDIWNEFQNLRPERGDLARMYELAHEWDKVVTEQAEENGDNEGGESGEGGMPMPSEFMEAVREALEEVAGNAEIGAIGEAGDQQTKEEYRETADRARSASEERKAHESVAGKVFGNGHTEPGKSGSGSTLQERRKPTSDERIAAVKISQALEKAKYQDRIRIETASELPPGRLRTRSLVQGEAYRERGVRSTVEPFSRVQRKHVDDPNLTIGVMVDISGSMGDAMEPMASAAWILSEATRRVQGKTAMVYYGSGVFPTLKPGQHLTDVNVYNAPDGTEKFGEAFKAVDGALTLLHGSGARLLVIVSDGEYTGDERRNAKKWIDRCAKAGVGVLWIGAGHYGETGKHYVNGRESQYIRMSKQATAAASEIGKTAASALTKAGESRKA